MELHRSDTSGLNLVMPCDTGEFLVNDVLYTQSIIVTAENVYTDWKAQTVADLTTSDFEMLAEFDAEIVILGTGKTLIFPDQRLFEPLRNQKCGYDVMNSRSACTTFNVLIGDDRKVIVALLSNR